jgi:putative membrane protein
MKKISLALAFALATLSMYSCGDGDKAKDSKEVATETNENKEEANALAVSEDDSKFLVFAAEGGMTEVEASKLAQSMGTSKQVKEFGDQMIKDHTTAGNELKSLAATKNVTLPTTVGEDKQKAINELSNKKGADFDKAYVNMMVDDHQKTVDEFKDASENSKDADIKAFATKTLPTLQGHLDHVKALKDGMK